MPPAIRHDILRVMRARSLSDREDIFSAGEAVSGWYVCVEGAVGVSASFASGSTLMLHVLRPGQWFGDLPLSASALQAHNAHAIGRTRIGQIELPRMSDLMESHPGFNSSLLGWQTMRLTSVFQLLEEHAKLQVPQRLARQLLRLARNHGVPTGDGHVRIPLRLLQSDLAALAGCARQRANGQIGEFVRQEIIEREGGNYILKSVVALEARAAEHSAPA